MLTNVAGDQGYTRLTRIVPWVFLVEDSSKLLVWMSLNAEGLPDGEDFEKKRQFPAIQCGDLWRHQSLVALDEVEQASLSLNISRRKGGMCTHP